MSNTLKLKYYTAFWMESKRKEKFEGQAVAEWCQAQLSLALSTTVYYLVAS